MITDLKPCRVCGKPVEILPNHAIESVCETCRAFDNAKDWIAEGKERNKPIINQCRCQKCGKDFHPASQSLIETVCPTCVKYHCKLCGKPVKKALDDPWGWDGTCDTCHSREIVAARNAERKPEGILPTICKACGKSFQPCECVPKRTWCVVCGGPEGRCQCLRADADHLDRLITLAGHQATYLAHVPAERFYDQALEVEASFYRISTYLETKLMPKKS